MAREKVYWWSLAIDDLTICLASTEKGALRVGISMERAFQGATYFKRVFPEAELMMNQEANQPLASAVAAALYNEAMPVSLGFDIEATPFHWKVWRTIEKIPFGTTRTYGEVARMAGSPGAARAVGQAMGRNPLPLIFP